MHVPINDFFFTNVDTMKCTWQQVALWKWCKGQGEKQSTRQNILWLLQIAYSKEVIINNAHSGLPLLNDITMLLLITSTNNTGVERDVLLMHKPYVNKGTYQVKTNLFVQTMETSI